MNKTEITKDKFSCDEAHIKFHYSNPRAGKAVTDYMEIFLDDYKGIERFERNMPEDREDETINVLVHFKSGTHNVHDIIWRVYNTENGEADIINVDLNEEEYENLISFAYDKIQESILTETAFISDSLPN